MIRAERTAWDAAVETAQPFTDHIFATVAGRKDLSQPSQRAELLQELLPIVRLIEEPVYRAHYVQRLARLAKVAEDVLRSELRKRPARPARREAADMPEPAPVRPARLRGEPAEEFCLALLLRSPELRREGTALSSELFLLEEHRAIFSAWREEPDTESIRDKVPQELLPHLDGIVRRELPVLEGTQLGKAFQDCVARIESRRLSAAKQASAAALADPDVQEHMRAAVEEAFVLQRTRSGGTQEGDPSSEDDTRASELATTLVEDNEMGRRLHQAPSGPKSAQPTEPSPQVEGEHR
jgi:DNA primase